MGSVRRFSPPLDQTLRALLFSLALLLLVSPAGPLRAQASAETGHVYTFGQALEITLTLPDENPAADARLFLRLGDSVTEIFVISTADGTARYRRDLRERALAPFTEVTYWWEYQNQEGETETTERTLFLYEDNRFEWEELQEGEITVQWVGGTGEEMSAAADIVRTSLQEITEILEAPPVGPVRVYVYPSPSDLQLALRLSGMDWVGGEAHPEVGVILITAPPSEQLEPALKQSLPHEVTHLVLYEQLGAQRYAFVPAWLVEGLASYFEQRPEPAYTIALEKAVESNALIPLSDLCHPFYALPPEKVILAYAESQSLVTYLHKAYGWSAVRSLLEGYGDGLDCVAGPKRVLGMDAAALERSWRGWLEEGTLPESDAQQTLTLGRIVVRDVAPWLFLLLFVSLPVLFFTIAGKQRTVQTDVTPTE